MNEKEETPTITPEEAEGVKMIQALQIFVGNSESEEVSLRNWRAMPQRERDQTKWAYHYFILNSKP